MISLMNRETCKLANIPEECIVEMTEHSAHDEKRTYPYTRLHIVDSKQGHDFYLEVVESKKYIDKLIADAKTPK